MADLKGLRIAIPARGNSGEDGVATALRAGGLSPHDVDLVEMNFPSMVAALASGAIDVAGALPEPLATVDVRNGSGVKWKRNADVVHGSGLSILGGDGIVAIAATSGYDARTDVVQVTGGLIVATRASGPRIRVFKAIPFAAPPVGDLRWRPPQPVATWDGIRRSDNFSPACIQRLTDPRSMYSISAQRSRAKTACT